MEPVCCLKRTREISYNLCIICQESRGKLKLLNASSAGIESIKEATEMRMKLRLCHYARDAVDRLSSIFSESQTDIPNLKWHLSCYGPYSNKNKIQAKLNSEQLTFASDKAAQASSSSTQLSHSHSKDMDRLLRSHTKPIDWKVCLFCQESRSSKKTCKVEFDSVNNQIMNNAKFVHKVFVRVANVVDLYAAEACYHNACLQQFKRDVKRAETENKSKDLAIIWLSQELREASGNGHVFELLNVWERYLEMANAIPVEVPPSYRSRLSTFKEALIPLVDEVYDFIVLRNAAPSERQTLLVPKDCAHVPVSKLIDTEDTDEMTIPIFRREDDEFLAMVHVALKLRSDILSHPAFTGVNVNQEAEIASVPNSVHMFLNLLLGDQSHFDECEEFDANELDGIRKDRVLSIGQDIVYGVCGNKNSPPKHVGLGLTLHKATRSRKLVNLFYKAGHIASYGRILSIDTGMAESTLKSIDKDTGAVVPPNLVPGRFVHFSADNIDINDSSLDGKNTFHATQIAVWQRGPPEETILDNVKPSDKVTLDIPPVLNKIYEVIPTKETDTPDFSGVKSEWFKDRDDLVVTKARATDMAFLYSRHNIETKPSWTSFNQSVTEVSPPKTTTGYMPIILAPAHELSTLNTVVLRAIRVAKSLGNKYAIVTVDQALFPKLMELKWTVPEYKDILIPRMGGLHISMNFLKVIGQHMEDSGLVEVFVESGLLGPNTAGKVMDGKSFAKGMRAHKIMWQSLWGILLPQIQLYLEENVPELSNSIQAATQVNDIGPLVEMLASPTFVFQMNAFINTKEDCTFKHWWQYMHMVNILLLFTRAQRDGIWELHLTSFKDMLPYFHRYDHTNYARWGPVFLALMHQLPEEVENEFRRGNFVVKGSEKKFNQVDPDHSLEWINGVGKRSGGIVGITKTISALTRWTLSYNLRALVATQTYEMFGIDNDELAANEATPARIRRDNADEANVVSTLKRLQVFINDSNTTKGQMINIATKDVATPEICDSLLKAHELGQAQLESFVEKRLVECSVPLKDTLSKMKAPTFATLYRLPLEGPKEKIHALKVDRNIYQRLIMAYHAGRSVDLKQVLSHELLNVPISIAQTNGMLRSGNKAILQTVLKKDTECPPRVKLEKSSCLIIDGQATVMALGKPDAAITFGDYADQFVGHVLKTADAFHRVDVVFDRYQEFSIKTGTRIKRTKKLRPIRRLIENRDVQLPKQWPDYMASEENKAELSAFLSESLISDSTQDKIIVVAGGFEEPTMVKTNSETLNTTALESTHEEADTRIIVHCIHSSAETVVVSARDTDVLLLLLAHFNKMKCKQLWMKSGTFAKPQYIPVHKIRENIPLEDNVMETILPFHAITGCDSVSYLYGHTKKTAWEVFEKHHQLLKDLGCTTRVSDKVARDAEAFICQIYKFTNTTSVDDIRVALFCKGKAQEMMPPTSDTLRLHTERANYQALIWRKAHEPKPDIAEPLDLGGWKVVEGKLRPVLMTLPPVPKSCRDIIFCGCKKGCMEKCGCRKGKEPMYCTPACKCNDSDIPCRNRQQN